MPNSGVKACHYCKGTGWIACRSRDGSLWKPIDSAPKAGEVLVWDGTNISIAEWSDGYWWAKANGCHVRAPNWARDLILLRPSHWMPLPSPPGGSE